LTVLGIPILPNSRQPAVHFQQLWLQSGRQSRIDRVRRQEHVRMVPYACSDHVDRRTGSSRVVKVYFLDEFADVSLSNRNCGLPVER